LNILYGDKYAPVMMLFSKRDVANLLNEEFEERSVRESIRQEQKMQQVQQKRKKKSNDRRTISASVVTRITLLCIR